jgi:hypothetical protein
MSLKLPLQHYKRPACQPLAMSRWFAAVGMMRNLEGLLGGCWVVVRASRCTSKRAPCLPTSLLAQLTADPLFKYILNHVTASVEVQV